MNTIPIPHNLKLCLNLNVNKSNQNNVVGMIKCMCGCDGFRIQYFGDLTKHFINNYILKTAFYNNEHIIYMNAICEKCKKEYIIFNNLTNGYDALIENKKTLIYTRWEILCAKSVKEMFLIFF